VHQVQPGTLTDREREALDLYQRGMSTRSIAIHLGVSRTTVRDRIGAALVKLERGQRAQQPSQTG
jgi:DNA-binding NarL/FixJ family response regulator